MRIADLERIDALVVEQKTLEKKEVIGKGREEKRLERLTGIEPAPKAWEAFVLPLN